MELDEIRAIEGKDPSAGSSRIAQDLEIVASALPGFLNGKNVVS